MSVVAETVGDEDKNQVISGLAGLSVDLDPRKRGPFLRQRVMSFGLGLVLVCGIRVATYTDQERAAFAPPPDCELEAKTEEEIEHELDQDLALRIERGGDETLLSRLAESTHDPHGSVLHSTLEYLMLADNHELRQRTELPRSGINVNIFSSVEMRMDSSLLDELWADVINPDYFAASLPRSKFACHSSNFFETRNHEGKTLNVRVSVTGDDEISNYGFVFRDMNSSDTVDARFVVRDVSDLNNVSLVTHEIGVRATEWFDHVPMFPRVRALENVANVVADNFDTQTTQNS